MLEAIYKFLFVLAQYEPPVLAVHQHLEILVKPQADDADRACRPYAGLYRVGLDAEGDVDRLAADLHGEREELDGVFAHLGVEILDRAARGALPCNGFGEVVRDGGSRVENQVAALPADDGAEHDAARQARYREFRDGVHYGDVIALVRDHDYRPPVVEQHLASGEVFQAAELVDGRVDVAPGVLEVHFPHGDGILVPVVDDVRTARVNQGTLAVVVDDEVALDQVDVDNLYHENSLEIGSTFNISQKGEDM